MCGCSAGVSTSLYNQYINSTGIWDKLKWNRIFEATANMILNIMCQKRVPILLNKVYNEYGRILNIRIQNGR